MKKKGVVGYMCMTDFYDELCLGCPNSQIVCGSVRDLRREKKCVNGGKGSCGIIEVELRVVKVVKRCRMLES